MSRREQNCLQMFQQVQACTTTITCLLLLHKLHSQKGGKVLSGWANTKFARENVGFKSMRCGCELPAELLVVPLGAQPGCGIIDLLQVVFEQSH